MYFSIVLGSGIYTFGANVDFAQPYELGIRINTEPSEMSPRTPLNSVPYALNVADSAITAKITNGLFPGFLFNNAVVLTASSGTYKPSAGTRAILVEVQGGGAGGGGAAQSASAAGAGGGGGAGAYACKLITFLADSYSYSVGQAASGGAPGQNNGENGNPSTFGNPAIITSGGGYSGIGSQAVNNTFPAAGGAGGTVTVSNNNIMNIDGGPGETGITLAGVARGGLGGISRFGASAPAVHHGNGNSGINYGSGGGGGAVDAGSVNAAGGNGAHGVIIISEYK